MKSIKGCIIILLLSNSLIFAQQSQKKIQVSLQSTTNSIVEISPTSIGKMESLGFNFQNNFDYLGRNFSENFDFNNDGFKDIVWGASKNPTVGSPVLLFFWDNIRKKYIENSSYFILAHGDIMFYYDTVSDFNNDGGLDIYVPIENYHGQNGKQPNYYNERGNHMPGNLMLNNRDSYNRVYIDTTTIDHGDRRDYLSYSSASLINYDDDDKKDLIVPCVNERSNQGFLAKKYSVTSGNIIQKESVFPWNPADRYKGQSHSMLFKNYNNLIYAFLQPKEDYADGINSQYGYTYPEVWIYEKASGNTAPKLIRRFELIRDKQIANKGSILNHDTFYISDLDKDGDEEIIIGMFSLPMSEKHFSIHVFDNQGNEITKNWFNNEEFTDHTSAHGNGFDLIDLNNDGLDDILFRDRFNSNDRDISILMNNGASFEQHIIKTNGPNGFNVPVDTNNDGKIEILKVQDQEKDINKVVTHYILSYTGVDSDGDGIIDKEDKCPNTTVGVVVNKDGCEVFSLPYNNFTIETKSETCADKNNGEISIKATATYNYKAIINNKTYNFENNGLLVPNLPHGAYNVCIEVVGQTFQQCYTLIIGKGGSLTGKTISSSKNSVNVEITEGTAPFEVSLNGSHQFKTNESNFSLEVNQGDLIVVKSAIACEGIYSKTIADLPAGNWANPNPTKGSFEISVSSRQKEVLVEIFSINSVLIMKGVYPVLNQKVQLNIENQPKGLYVVRTHSESPVSVIIIKE